MATGRSYVRVGSLELPPLVSPKTPKMDRIFKPPQVANGTKSSPLLRDSFSDTHHAPSTNTRLYLNPSGSYTLRTQLSQGFLATALLAANASQLKHHLDAFSHPYYEHVLWLLIGSIGAQVAATLCLLFSYWARSKLEPVELMRKRRPRCCVSCADFLENIYMLMTFFIMAVNVFIALFVGLLRPQDASPITAAYVQRNVGAPEVVNELSNGTGLTAENRQINLTTVVGEVGDSSEPWWL